MASRIQGITVEIGGDTTKLSKALESVNKSIKGTQSGLKDVNKLLKLDPSNTELVVQKQKMLTKDFLTHRSSINKGEAPRYYVKNHHVGIIDRVTWDKVQAMLYEKPRSDTTKGPGRKKAKSMKGSPFGNLRCGAILENGSNAGKPCGEGFFRVTYTGVANGYTDERSLKAMGEDTGEYLEKYSYSYPIWRCKRKMGEREDEPPKNGTPDQKMYSRSKKGCMSNAEKEAADKRCPSEIYHECALEQSFMELLYSMKRDYEQNGEASMIMAMFNNVYEQMLRQAKNNSISVQRVAAVGEYGITAEEIMAADAIKFYLQSMEPAEALKKVAAVYEPKVIWLDSGEGVPVQSIIDGEKYAAFIDEAVRFAVQEVEDSRIIEKLESIDGKHMIESASVEFMSFIEEAYKCLRW